MKKVLLPRYQVTEISHISKWTSTWETLYRGYKTFLMPNSTEHEISTGNKKLKRWRIKPFFAFTPSGVAVIMLINVKIPTIVSILTFMSMIYFMLSWIEHENGFITSRPCILGFWPRTTQSKPGYQVTETSYCRASQDWQWRLVLFTMLSVT